MSEVEGISRLTGLTHKSNCTTTHTFHFFTVLILDGEEHRCWKAYFNRCT
jgi:hypothetical protein